MRVKVVEFSAPSSLLRAESMAAAVMVEGRVRVGAGRILGPADQGSPVYATNLPKMTCGRCHGDLRVTEKFDLKADAVQAFEDSFHGLAGRSGNRTVANCASCHGDGGEDCPGPKEAWAGAGG